MSGLCQTAGSWYPHPQRKWVHRDSNPGSSPCKGDVITNWTMNPSTLQFKMHISLTANISSLFNTFHFIHCMLFQNKITIYDIDFILILVS